MGLGLLLAGAGFGESASAKGELTRTLPSHEVEILLAVGQEYGLTDDQTKLLLAIRKIENGGPGLEMGVASDYPGHRSHRHAGDPAKSLRLQARWAAGTIRRHYTGDLDAFAKRYCPPKWEHWRNMARHWMNRE
jgi:hypothetical protein